MAEEAEVGGHVVLQKAEGEGGPQVTEVLSNGCILGRGGGGRGECSALCSARCTAVLTGVRVCGCADERLHILLSTQTAGQACSAKTRSTSHSLSLNSHINSHHAE